MSQQLCPNIAEITDRKTQYEESLNSLDFFRNLLRTEESMENLTLGAIWLTTMSPESTEPVQVQTIHLLLL